MHTDNNSKVSDVLFSTEDFSFDSLEEEIAVDELCHRLLRIFLQDLTCRQGVSPLVAGQKTGGADYFLRDFIISNLQMNIFHVEADEITSFAGNWYIIKNLEPNTAELAAILDGVKEFYRFCLAAERIDEKQFEGISKACARTEYYHQRIEDFWAITDDGYFSWDAACPIKR